MRSSRLVCEIEGNIAEFAVMMGYSYRQAFEFARMDYHLLLALIHRHAR